MNRISILWFFVSMLILWFVLTGSLEWSSLIVGILCALVVTYFFARFCKVTKLNLFNQVSVLRLLLFIPPFIVELIKANLNMARLILFAPKVTPQLISIKNTTKTQLGEYLLAVVLTLTPGSLILEYNHDELLLHVIDEHSKHSVLSLDLNHMIEKIEKPTHKHS